jgi:glycosyltransferase involved in cell wall biosynthesis
VAQSEPSVILLIADGLDNKRGLNSVNLELANTLASKADGRYEVYSTTLTEPDTAVMRPDVKALRLSELSSFDISEKIDAAGLGSRIRVVFGHAHVTGKFAMQIAKSIGAKFVLMHHTIPGLYDHNRDKWDTARTDEKNAQLIELTKSAHAVISVGPLIYGSWRQTIGRKPALLYQPLGGQAFVESDPPEFYPDMLPDVLYVGAADQAEMRSKGIERMAGYLSAIRKGLGMNIRFSIVGAPSDEARIALAAFGGPWASVGSMLTQAEVVTAMRQATVVVMPSILEPFGMVGLEAMLAGVPALVTADSGLAMWLEKFLPGSLYNLCVARTDDEWKAKLGAMLANVKKAIDDAAKIKKVLLSTRNELFATPGNWLSTMIGTIEFRVDCVKDV